MVYGKLLNKLTELSTLVLFVKMEYSKKGGRLTSFLFI